MIHDWHRFTVPPEASLLDALKVIDDGAMQFAIVVSGQTLVGIVTDGDVRRALVRGASTGSRIDEVMNPNPVCGTLAEGPPGWRLKLRRHQIRHLPVVDASRQLQHLVTDQPSQGARDNWVVLMAGGLGTRLRPLTENIPKPMIEVGGRPILESIVDTLAHHGFRRLFLSVNYRADMIESHFRDGSAFGLQIEYLREPARLGTAGALAMLPHRPTAPLLVMNGDILTGLDLGGFVDTHVEQGSAITIGAREFNTQIPYGVLDLEGEVVRGIREKPSVTSIVSAGIYAVAPDVLGLLPGPQFFDMPTLVEHAVASGRRVRAQVIRDYWIDVGRLEDLDRARLHFEQGDQP